MPKAKPKLLGVSVASNPGAFNQAALEGIVNIKSVYDTDSHDYMGPAALTLLERAVTPIPQITPADSSRDTRDLVADIQQLKNLSAEQRPARFLRVVQAQITPPGLSNLNVGSAAGFEMRKLLGYSAVEADGSVQVKVPANRPFTLSVVDRYGRAFSEQSSWLQLLPGQTLQCNGCHSPRDSVSINPASMAEGRGVSNPASLALNENMSDSFSSVSYLSLQTQPPLGGVIDYVEHIQPIFDLPRSAQGACSSCHDGLLDSVNNPSGLNLKGDGAGSSNVRSYDVLLNGEVFLNENGQPILELIGGLNIPKRQLSLVSPGYARGSYLIEKIFNEELFAERGIPDSGLDHSSMLNDAEKRLLSEWVDMGAQYINSPFDESGNIRSSAGNLSLATFGRIVSTALMIKCGSCHRLFDGSGGVNDDLARGFFILYGDSAQDFASASRFVTDFNNPESSIIISTPSGSSSHPTKDGQPYLTSDMVLYQNLVQWISEGAVDSSTVKISVPFVAN